VPGCIPQPPPTALPARCLRIHWTSSSNHVIQPRRPLLCVVLWQPTARSARLVRMVRMGAKKQRKTPQDESPAVVMRANGMVLAPSDSHGHALGAPGADGDGMDFSGRTCSGCARGCEARPGGRPRYRVGSRHPSHARPPKTTRLWCGSALNTGLAPERFLVADLARLLAVPPSWHI
jgi:hypothetical protein